MPDVGNRHRLWWGIFALVGCMITTALARAAAPYAALVRRADPGLDRRLRAAARGRQGRGGRRIRARRDVRHPQRPAERSPPRRRSPSQSAAGGVAGLVLLILAGLGRGAAPRGPAAIDGRVVRSVAVAVATTARLRAHGLRVGLAIAFAVALASVLGPSFGYWIPLTVLAVLQPDSHSSRVRLLQRAAGTVVGAGLVVLVTLVTANPVALVALVTLFTLALFAVKDRSYFWMVILLTPTALLMIASTTVEGPGIALQRLINTAIGLAIGLVAMNVFAETAER